MRQAIVGVLLLLLAGCGTSVHDMLYYPPVDGRQSSRTQAPPVASNDDTAAPSSETMPREAVRPPERVATRDVPPETAVEPPPAPAAEPPQDALSRPAAQSAAAPDEEPSPGPSRTAPTIMSPPPAMAEDEPSPPQGLPEGTEPPVAMAEPQTARAAPAPAVSAAAEAKCKSVAQQRADDGAENGLDEDTQKTVFDGTYADCMAWQAKHGLDLD